LVALDERAIAEGTPWLRPQIAFSILEVLNPKPHRVILSNGTELRGFGIARKLTCAASVIAAVATLGSELERQIQGATQEQPTLALSLDGFGTAAIRALTTALFVTFLHKKPVRRWRPPLHFIPEFVAGSLLLHKHNYFLWSMHRPSA
jgi:hypothetical protein